MMDQTPQTTTNVASPGLEAARANHGASSPPAIETPSPAPEPKDDSKELDFSRRFAALSRKEKEIQQRDRQWKENQGKYISMDDFKANPEEALRRIGMPIENLLTLLANDNKPTTEMSVRELQNKLESLTQELQNERQSKQKQETDREISNFKQSIKGFVDQNMDDFELIHSNDAYDLVYNVIEENFARTKEILPLQDAAKVVEDYLEKELENKILKTKKASRLFSAKSGSPETAMGTRLQAEDSATRHRESPILSQTALAASPAPSGGKRLSREESIRRSVALLRERLAVQK